MRIGFSRLLLVCTAVAVLAGTRRACSRGRGQFLCAGPDPSETADPAGPIATRIQKACELGAADPTTSPTCHQRQRI